MITEPKRHKHPSSGANRPSDIPETVNINAEFDQMAVNTRLQCFQGISSRIIVTVQSLVLSTLPLPLLSNPSMVTKIDVHLACRYTSTQRIILLPT